MKDPGECQAKTKPQPRKASPNIRSKYENFCLQRLLKSMHINRIITQKTYENKPMKNKITTRKDDKRIEMQNTKINEQRIEKYPTNIKPMDRTIVKMVKRNITKYP